MSDSRDSDMGAFIIDAIIRFKTQTFLSRVCLVLTKSARFSSLNEMCFSSLTYEIYGIRVSTYNDNF